MLTFLMLTPDF